jgi:hypothetical protein
MLQNKKTQSDVVKPFKSVPNNPNVMQKRVDRHKPQKLTVRVANADIAPNGDVTFSVNSKLLEDLYDECLVGCESFYLNQTGTVNSYPVNLNITSPLFTNGRQYIPVWSGGGGEYSSIIASVLTPQLVLPGAWSAVCFQQQVTDHGLGCFTTNKQILNNFDIPFTITSGNTNVPYRVSSGFSLQFTLVFYGLNDDERYSEIPSGIYS